jgi:hypothetical protein
MRFDDLIKKPAKPQKPLTYTESLQAKLDAEMSAKPTPKFTAVEWAIMEGGGSLEEDTIEERKRKRKKNKSPAYGPGPYGWYGYYAGYSGDSSGEGGDGGGGESIENENFADGKNPGRKGLAKRSGVNTKASVSSLRKTAKNSSGEKQRMAHWLANMKAGKAKKK